MAGYVALVHKNAGTSYGVSFPDLPGCISAGDTLDEALANAAELSGAGQGGQPPLEGRACPGLDPGSKPASDARRFREGGEPRVGRPPPEIATAISTSPRGGGWARDTVVSASAQGAPPRFRARMAGRMDDASLCFVLGVNRGVAGARRVPYRVVRKWGALEAPAAASLSTL